MLGIIIPTYDSLDTLKPLVSQIYTNTDTDFTLYVIEDGLKPETIAFLQAIKQPKFQAIYHEKNKGVAPSWNDGLRQAMQDGCDYLAVFNDDIEVPAGWWKPCLDAFTEGADLVFLSDPSPIKLTGWFFILSRKCVEKVGYFDEQFYPYFGEDDDYFHRFKRAGLKYAQVDLNVLHHGSHTIKKLGREQVEAVRMTNFNKFMKKYPNTRRAV